MTPNPQSHDRNRPHRSRRSYLIFLVSHARETKKTQLPSGQSLSDDYYIVQELLSLGRSRIAAKQTCPAYRYRATSRLYPTQPGVAAILFSAPGYGFSPMASSTA